MKNDIIRLIAEEANIATCHIQLDTRLEEDLGLDSLDLLSLQLEIENYLEILVQDEPWSRCVTVRDVIELATKLSTQQTA